MRFRRPRVLTTTLAAASALAVASIPAASASVTPAHQASVSARQASAHRSPAALTISGTVSDPVSYTESQLAALPAETVQLPGPGGHGKVTATGVSLDSLVTTASPVLPAAKNALLRVIVTASGPRTARGPRIHPVSFALGELDPSFGNHDALVVLSVNGRSLPAGPALAVPGDRTSVRELPVVSHVEVGVANPAVAAPPSPGDLVIEDGPRRAVLKAVVLASLPKETKMVTFLSGAGQETHTETGPALASVLAAAHLRPGSDRELNTWVAAVGSDGYVATVTPAEASAGNRPLLISLTEDGIALAAPRLVTDGDIKGGRYVSGVYDLVVGQGAPVG